MRRDRIHQGDLTMRIRSTTAMAVGLVGMLLAGAPGSVRGDIPPRPPPPPPKPTMAGAEVPRPLYVVVAGAALAAAIASGGVWLARGSGMIRRVSRFGGIVAAAAIVSGTGLLAFWSHSALRNYQAEKDRIDAEYRIRLQNWHPLGPVRRPEKTVAPGSSKTTPAPGPS
jgi:hypothetical protein